MATARQQPRTRPRQGSTPPPAEMPHVGFILAEEDMLKTYLEQNVTVPNAQGVEVPVRVWYRYPAPEHATTFPFITIDWIGLEPAYDLWMSDYRLLANSEKEEHSTTGDTSGWRLYDPSISKQTDYGDPINFFWRQNYLQYRLFYQLGIHANNVVHDRIMNARMITDYILPRPSWLYCEADGVWKRMESLGWVSADIPTQEGAARRIFRKLYTMSIQTDIPQDRLANLMLQPRIRKMLYRILDRDTMAGLTGDDDTSPDITTIPPTEYWVEGASNT